MLRTGALALLASLMGADTAAAGADAAPVDDAEVKRHSTYNPGPELQRTPGGNLIVNAFIMEGPVRVEIRDSRTDELVFERQEQDALFPFEVSPADLTIAPEQAVVRIFIRGHLSHQLRFHP